MLKRVNDAVRFEATNPQGAISYIDGSSVVGGDGNGFRPTEMVLVGLAGCSGIDMVDLLKKMRQSIDDMKIDVIGKQREEHPTLFTEIHLHFTIWGDLKEKKVEKAMNMSLEKYCTVAKILEKTATISGTFEIIKK